MMTGPVDLAPRESVLFISQGGHDQDGRFLEVLKETWQLVPSDCRKAILSYYGKRFNGWPVVRLAPLGGAGTAGGPNDPFMLWFDSSTILNWPRGKYDAALVIAEELAHAFMFAVQHPSHMQDPPNNDKTSQEYLAWDKAREDAMKEVLFSWPFVDRAHHENLIAAVEAKARSIRKGGQPTTSDDR
jgi:hypothetical protein